MTIVIAASGSELIERLRRLEALPLGLRLDGVLAAQLSPLPGGYQPLFDGATYFREAIARVAAIPGINPPR